jgi:hypothetical protein
MLLRPQKVYGAQPKSAPPLAEGLAGHVQGEITYTGPSVHRVLLG